MEQELNLGEAARALNAEYGDSFEAGMEEGEGIMASTLQDRLGISHADADKLVDAMIEAQTVRWQGHTTNMAIPQSGEMQPITAKAESGTWYL